MEINQETSKKYIAAAITTNLAAVALGIIFFYLYGPLTGITALIISILVFPFLLHYAYLRRQK